MIFFLMEDVRTLDMSQAFDLEKNNLSKNISDFFCIREFKKSSKRIWHLNDKRLFKNKNKHLHLISPQAAKLFNFQETRK